MLVVRGGLSGFPDYMGYFFQVDEGGVTVGEADGGFAVVAVFQVFVFAFVEEDRFVELLHIFLRLAA